MPTTEAFSEVSPLLFFNRSQSDSPTVLKPYIHGSKPAHLAKNLLLTRLGGNGLSQKLANFTRVEMIDESPDTRFSETSQALHKVEPLTNGSVWIVVDALLGRSLTEHISQEGSVSALLVGHELDEGHVL